MFIMIMVLYICLNYFRSLFQYFHYNISLVLALDAYDLTNYYATDDAYALYGLNTIDLFF